MIRKFFYGLNLLIQIILIYLLLTNNSIVLIPYIVSFLIHVIFLTKKLEELKFSEINQFLIIFIGIFLIICPILLWAFEIILFIETKDWNKDDVNIEEIQKELKKDKIKNFGKSFYDKFKKEQSK